MSYDRTGHREECPWCRTKSLAWVSRYPDDPRAPLQTQCYRCDQCGPYTIPLMEMRRCWHCTAWCQQRRMVRGRSYHSRARPVNNWFCSVACRDLEHDEERKIYRYAGIVKHYGQKLRAALKRFLEK